MLLTRFITYKIATPPLTPKTKEGKGPQTDKHLLQSPFTGPFFRRMTLPSISLIFLRWYGLDITITIYLRGGGHKYYLPPFLAV
jgi:hypothetical protein